MPSMSGINLMKQFHQGISTICCNLEIAAGIFSKGSTYLRIRTSPCLVPFMTKPSVVSAGSECLEIFGTTSSIIHPTQIADDETTYRCQRIGGRTSADYKAIKFCIILLDIRSCCQRAHAMRQHNQRHTFEAFPDVIYNDIHIHYERLYTTVVHISPVFLLKDTASVPAMIAGDACDSLRRKIFHKGDEPFFAAAQPMNQVYDCARLTLRSHLKHT